MKNSLFVYLCCLPWLAGAAGVEPGKELFRNHCKACHSIDQKLVGPALKDIHLRRDSTWLYQFIKNSQAMVQSGDATAVALFNEHNQIIMPNQNLSDTQITSILDYLKAESAPKAAAANPIQRPLRNHGTLYRPMRFTDYTFWMPFTLSVIFLIIILYYLTIITDIRKNRSFSDTD
jgi:cytochrome c551/c552